MQLLIYNHRIMRWIILITISFFFVQCSGAQPSKENSEQEKPLSESILIDVRTPGEYSQGTAGDAINIPVDDLEKRLGELPKDKDAKIVVFCLSGGRSSHAKFILEENGYNNVHNGGTYSQMRAKLNKEQESSKTKS